MWRFRTKTTKVQQILFGNQLHAAGLQLPFPAKVSIMVDWYVLEKTVPYREAVVQFTDGIFCIPWPEPNLRSFNSPISKTIIAKVMTESNNGLQIRKGWHGLTILDTTRTGEFPFVHGANYTLSPPVYRMKQHPHIHQNEQKVIFCSSGRFRAMVDTGKFGIGDHVHYLLEKDIQKAEFIVSFANSDLMCFLQSLLTPTFFSPKSWSLWNAPAPLKQVKLEPVGSLTNEQIYQHFGLTADEIAAVKKYIKG